VTFDEAQECLRKVAIACWKDASQVATAHSTETVDLEKALGRHLAVDVRSEIKSPPFANSAMDGFALRAGETVDLSEFQICGVIYPGDLPPKSTPLGAAWEITTGAPLPLDCDAVVKIEDISRIDHSSSNASRILWLKSQAKSREFIRPAGEDYQIGSLVLRAGTQLGALHLMALASVNCSQVLVFRKPRVVLLPTGRELHRLGERGETGQIVNSSAIYLAASWRQLGCDVETLPILRDDVLQFDQILKQLLLDPPDLFVTTGAVSMGSADFIRTGLEQHGFTIHFHRLSIRPGKPILFAEKKQPVKHLVMFGLPGNPISSVVGSRFFVEGYLRILLGESLASSSATASGAARVAGDLIQNVSLEPKIEREQLVLNSDVQKPDGLRCFFRGRRAGGGVSVHAEQGSSLVRPLVESDSWVILPETGTKISAGQKVDVQSF